MVKLENEAARLKAVGYLLSEALRLADEGAMSLAGAKIADCMECIGRGLADVTDQITEVQAR